MTSIYKISCFIFLLLSLSATAGMARQVQQDTARLREEPMQDVAYTKLPAWKVVGAISTVKGIVLQKNLSSNLGTTLYGRIPGLTVMQGGNEPGLESPSIYSRGVGTLGAGRGPLIMVDGYESNYEQLIPAEIESVSLLKDAASTAMYGSRAANGVLLVTTKRGSDAPLAVNFRVQAGFNEATRLPQFLGSHDYARLYNEALRNDGRDEMYSESAMQAYQSGSNPYFFPDVNWYDEVLRKSAPIENYNLTFTGGSPAVRYFGALNYIDNSSLLIKSGKLSDNSVNGGYRRYNFRTNVDVSLTKRITASLTLAGSIEDKSNPAADNTGSIFTSIATLAPNAFPVYNPDGTYGGSAIYSNPLGDLLEKGQYSSNGRTLQSTLKLTHALDMVTPGLSLAAAVSFNNYFKNYSSKSRQYQRFSIADDGSGNPAYTGYGQNTSLTGNENQSEQWRNVAAQAFLNYSHSFGVQDVDAMLMASSDSYTVSNDAYPFKHLGMSGFVNYGFDDKYIAEFSFSYMGSENFPRGNRYGFFPAAALGWIISNEDFLKGNTIIRYLKLRSSYGLVGNDNIGGSRFMFDQTFRYPGAYYFGTGNTSSSSIEEARLANPDVTWEKGKQFDIGLELQLMNRVQLTADFFHHDRYDILVTPNRIIPGYYGIDLPLLNEGRVISKGFEATLGYTGKPAGKFQYSLLLSGSYAKNEIRNMSEELRQFDYQYQTGGLIGQPYGLEAIGFFRDEADIASRPRQIFTTVKPGDLIYKDQNEDGIIDVSDYKAIGKPDYPTLTIGFTPGFSYAGFDLELHFQAVTGRSAYLSGLEFQAFQNNGKISEIAMGRWTPETAGSATYPRLSAENNPNNFLYGTFWQRNGNFIKLRSLEIGYSLKPALVRRIGLESSRIFLNGTNLLSWDKVDYADPEAMPGVVGYPAVRTISAGIAIGF